MTVEAWIRTSGADMLKMADMERALFALADERNKMTALAKSAIGALEDLASQLHANGVHAGPCIEFGQRIQRHLKAVRGDP
jgi:hypothetical protein